MRPDGRDDTVVRAAPADVPFEGVGDLGLGRIRLPEEQGVGLHDHARRAVAALEGAVIDEGLLERMQAAALGQALDGQDALPSTLARGNWQERSGLPSTRTVQKPQ